jgi:23S rRNA pseudouridine955/2504/2580 synthase
MPIVGDNKYRGTSLFDRTESEVDLAERLHLHALRLILDHPTQRQDLDVTAPMPKDLQTSLRAVGFDPVIKYDPFADGV